MNYEILKDVGLISAVVAILVYAIKRAIERKSDDESLDRKIKTLKINKELSSQGISVDGLYDLENVLLGKTQSGHDFDVEALGTKEEIIERNLEIVGKLYEIIAIHAGNEARDAYALKQLSDELVSGERLDLARATFHAAIRQTRKLLPNSENLKSLEEYEQEIPIPSTYRKRLDEFGR